MDIKNEIIVKEEELDPEFDCSDRDSQNSNEHIFVCTGIKQEENTEDSEFSQGVAQDSKISQQMPSRRVRYTNKASWTIESMQAALNAVETGTSIRKASKQYNIPFSTIKDRIKAGSCYGPSMGTKCIFTQEQEVEIKNHVILLAELYFGLTYSDLRKLAFDYAEKNGIKNNFSKENRQAGKDWLYGFLKRHPTLSLRKPEATSLTRVLAFNKENVQLFYSNLETLMTKFNFPATRIYNVDETGISTVKTPSRIVTPKGMKQVGSLTSWEKGKNITVCCCFSASGHYIPPMFIFPSARMPSQLERGGFAGEIYRCSPNGWITAELFTEWLQHFAKESNSSTDQPVLLVLDNHSSHTSLPSYLFCKRNGIHVVSIPPHSSHRLQPLDLCFFGPLKVALNRECDIFLKTRGSDKITTFDMPDLFRKAYCKVLNLEKAAKGFERSGIWPFNPNIYTDEDFMPGDNLCSTKMIECDDKGPESLQKEDDSSLKTSEVMPDSPNQQNATESGVDISPVPGPSTNGMRQKNSSRPNRAKQHSKILTATPAKKQMEELEKRKSRKRKLTEKNQEARTGNKDNINKRKEKQKLFDSSSEEDVDDSLLCNDDDSNEILHMEEDIDSEICTICGEFGRNNEVWFRCKMCGKWSHRECTSVDIASNYICDYCLN